MEHGDLHIWMAILRKTTNKNNPKHTQVILVTNGTTIA